MFDLPSNVIAAVLIALALMLCAIGLFAWYLRRQYGVCRPRVSSQVVRPRRNRRKPRRGRK
ncbi:exported hypothetical protein [Cupriavidus taiwanensis]|nr:exported hypothetical protein [Cupriavidus taiwanensis]